MTDFRVTRRMAAVLMAAGLVAGCGTSNPGAINYKSDSRSKQASLAVPPNLIDEASDPRSQQFAHDIRAIAQDAQYVIANSASANSGGVGGADNCAHGRASDRHRTNPHFVQGLQRQNMRDSARSAASKRNSHL